ncbi:hypothetical protein AB0L70_09890 [Kribbella sp. NPDC051952]|uniref:sunset domain-containing protein n=1 Tax=Kribbella sp. NPDC051952 TaxID=3154851 RepID=UPI0034240DCB
MSWLLRHNWLWSLLAFVLGAVITWLLLDRRHHPAPLADQPAEEEVAEEKEEVLVGARVAEVQETGAADTRETRPAIAQEARAAEVREEPRPVFSQLMEPEPTLFDDVENTSNATQPQMRSVAPPGRYGEGSAEAVPHQGPPDGFTIKGNAQSMLFHTPDSPYYGRTKPEVWFRTEADAERAGFTKYTRRPRKSANPSQD